MDNGLVRPIAGMARGCLPFESMAASPETDKRPATEATPRREKTTTPPGTAPYPLPVTRSVRVNDHATGLVLLPKNLHEALGKGVRPLSVVLTSTRAAAVLRRPRTAAANMINGLRGVQERCP